MKVHNGENAKMKKYKKNVKIQNMNKQNCVNTKLLNYKIVLKNITILNTKW